MLSVSGILFVMNALSKEESDCMLGLLESAVRQSRVPIRRLERELGLSQGYLTSVFKGRIQLKVSHVYGIAYILEMEPLFFFLHASPPKSPEWLMRELGIGTNIRPPFLADGEPLPGRREMLEAIQTAIQSELEQLFREQSSETGLDQG